jgi:hypothetical protein
MNAQKTTAAKTTYLFDGFIVTESPFATCSPSLSATSGKGPKLVPTIKTPDGEKMLIPGQGIRSNLRGALTQLACEYARANNQTYKLADAQLLRIGGVKQGGDEVTISIADRLKMLAANPLLNLFGAGDPWVEGKAMIGQAIDTRFIQRGEYEPHLIDGVRARMLQREPGLLEFMDENSVDAINAELKAVRESSDAKKKLKEMEAAIKKEKDADAKAELKRLFKLQLDASKETIINSELMPLSGYKAIPPGAKLSHAMRLLSVSELDLGAFLASIKRFSAMPVLGAHHNNGCGEVSAEYDVTAVGVGKIGSIAYTWAGGTIIKGDVLLDALAVFENALADATLDFKLDPAILVIKKAKEEKGAGDE